MDKNTELLAQTLIALQDKELIMVKEKDVLKSLSDSSVSRRYILKGLAAVNALGVAVGCSKNDDPEVIYGGGNQVV